MTHNPEDFIGTVTYMRVITPKGGGPPVIEATVQFDFDGRDCSVLYLVDKVKLTPIFVGRVP